MDVHSGLSRREPGRTGAFDLVHWGRIRQSRGWFRRVGFFLLVDSLKVSSFAEWSGDLGRLVDQACRGLFLGRWVD